MRLILLCLLLAASFAYADNFNVQFSVSYGFSTPALTPDGQASSISSADTIYLQTGGSSRIVFTGGSSRDAYYIVHEEGANSNKLLVFLDGQWRIVPAENVFLGYEAQNGSFMKVPLRFMADQSNGLLVELDERISENELATWRIGYDLQARKFITPFNPESLSLLYRTSTGYQSAYTNFISPRKTRLGTLTQYNIIFTYASDDPVPSQCKDEFEMHESTSTTVRGIQFISTGVSSNGAHVAFSKDGESYESDVELGQDVRVFDSSFSYYGYQFNDGSPLLKARLISCSAYFKKSATPFVVPTAAQSPPHEDVQQDEQVPANVSQSTPDESVAVQSSADQDVQEVAAANSSAALDTSLNDSQAAVVQDQDAPLPRADSGSQPASARSHEQSSTPSASSSSSQSVLPAPVPISQTAPEVVSDAPSQDSADTQQTVDVLPSNPQAQDSAQGESQTPPATQNQGEPSSQPAPVQAPSGIIEQIASFFKGVFRFLLGG